MKPEDSEIMRAEVVMAMLNGREEVIYGEYALRHLWRVGKIAWFNPPVHSLGLKGQKVFL
jgi:hypothetical protein